MFRPKLEEHWEAPHSTIRKTSNEAASLTSLASRREITLPELMKER